MLTRQQQFKVAFLHVCAEQGLSVEESLPVIKEAIAAVESGEFTKEGGILGGIGKGLGYLGGKAMDIGASGAKILGAAAVLLPVAVGGAAGYALGKNTGGVGEEDVEAEKQQELIDAYRSAAERANSRRQVATRKRATPPRARSLV